MTGSGALTPDLRTATLAWIADDPHPGDRAELQQLLDRAGDDGDAAAELADRMRAPLAFGTAGLRGALRAGPGGMNLATVRRAAAGVARYLREQGDVDRVVVGFDARHRSSEFARDVAGVLAAAGFPALLASGPVPTPVTAYATRALAAAAGIQVTASHNPPQDNGLKVYLRGGTQLVGPADGDIENAIRSAGPARDIDTGGEPQPWPPDLVESYRRRAAAVATVPAATALRVAATALHGVGAALLVDTLALAGITDVHQVPEQERPDPDFPTVVFPNPEEPGACDLLLDLAARIGADVAVANDPDADRCSIGVPTGSGWRMLSGDETGTLLGDHLLRRLDRTAHPDPLVATTIVSSEQLRAVAGAHGARHDETLTGFKWIVRAGDGAGTGLVFGYEEALGLAVDPDAVRDKDGISAAVLACDLVATLKSEGRTVQDRLDELARRDGLYTTGALSVRVTDLSLIGDALRRLRAAPPDRLAGERVESVEDLLPRTDGLVLRTATQRVVVRPSGTEPKLKCYLQVVDPVPPGTGDLAPLRARAQARLDDLRAAVEAAVGLAPA
ncbi:phospho-sugar mutase [Nakamurella endophytica]|uniref:Phosphoglucomutase n=1 Tax=Nakamurella endophytica TaxID=1748367 RepID=A0A917WGG2_9ACTN|nr:phospho-sugar mutase [Nakamurella endophytica]GGM02090.1 phosphoglucomutase [Nakamurella endophytica]